MSAANSRVQSRRGAAPQRNAVKQFRLSSTNVDTPKCRRGASDGGSVKLARSLGSTYIFCYAFVPALKGEGVRGLSAMKTFIHA